MIHFRVLLEAQTPGLFTSQQLACLPPQLPLLQYIHFPRYFNVVLARFADMISKRSLGST